MGLFGKLVAIGPLQPYLQLEDAAFIEDPGWRDVLAKIKQLKDGENLRSAIEGAAPVREKEKIILGYLCTMAAEMASGPVDLPCVDYAGCYLTRGVLRLRNTGEDYAPGFVGLGMNASNREAKIIVEGNVGDHLGYRSPQANIEVRGKARDRVGMAMGEGTLKIEGEVAGGLAGNTHNCRIEVDGSVGRINRENVGCKILVGGDVHWGIGESQAECFIKVCGSLGSKHLKSGKLTDVASKLTKNTVLLVGGDVYGHIGRGMELAKVLVWGRVHGEIHVSDTQGGFVYLHKKSTPLLQRVAKSIGGAIGVKYVTLKDSGYIFAEEPDDIKEIILG
jgi:formylmethanofuran dehydrogenase subunit C